MSRYIDADALMATYAKHEFCSDMGDAMEILDHAPSIDIVFCKECRWYKKWKTIGRDDGYCEYARMTQDGLQYVNANPDDFCSYGERSERYG